VNTTHARPQSEHRVENDQSKDGIGASAAFDLVAEFQSLFPGSNRRHNVLESLDAQGGKYAPVRSREAKRGAYSRHLSAGSLEGPGALGIFPGYLPAFALGGQERRWQVRFIVLDFDEPVYDEIATFLLDVVGMGQRPLMSFGTTGRGAHAVLLLSEPVAQPLAHEHAVSLARLAQKAGLPKPEIRPSAAYASGSPIFLPYRGAALDGLGANPLFDLPSGLNIPLYELANYAAPLVPIVSSTTSSSAHLAGPTSVRKAATPDGVSYWQHEIDRIRPHWHVPNRQWLALALSAVGVAWLGLETTTVLSDLLALERASEKPELTKRQAAVLQTASRVQKGERVAYAPFYSRAGVEAPELPRLPWIVQAKLEALRRELYDSKSWTGRGADGDRLALAALIEFIEKHGVNHPAGICVSLSLREWAEAVGRDRRSLARAVERLKRSGRISSLRSSAGGHASLRIAAVSADDTICPHSPNEELDDFPLLTGGQGEWGHIRTHLAFGHGVLNQSGAKVLIAVLTAGGPLRARDIARLANMNASTAKNAVARLADWKVVRLADGFVTAAPSWRSRLDEVAVQSGASLRNEVRREQHQAERTAFAKRVGYGR
jgi:hypothetical protein